MRYAFSLIELLIVIAIIAVLIGLLVPAVQRIRDTAARLQCVNHLHQIGLALHGYHGANGRLPPGVSVQGGTDSYPFMSWNTRLLPYLEQDGVWRQSLAAYRQNADFRVDPPHPFTTVLAVYGCPSEGRTLAPGYADGLRVAFTAYLGVLGTNLFRKDGVMFIDSQVRFADITDGASNTLMAGERPPSADGLLGWWYAGWGQNQDGSAEMLLGVRERNVEPRYPYCPAGPYSFRAGRPDETCDVFHFWSMHIGGANFLFCDGSVRFLAYSADPLLPALATRAGGEPAALPD
jgi:prepilin-type N-terminal cleavage/methylation domain-containing protein/prepilin-type processing-associated H-X9-DG protein